MQSVKAALATAEKCKMRTAVRLCRSFPCDFAKSEIVQASDVDAIAEELKGMLLSNTSLTEITNLLDVLLGNMRLSAQVREILEDLLPLIRTEPSDQFSKAACDAVVLVIKFIFSELYNQRKSSAKVSKRIVIIGIALFFSIDVY